MPVRARGGPSSSNDVASKRRNYANGNAPHMRADESVADTPNEPCPCPKWRSCSRSRVGSLARFSPGGYAIDKLGARGIAAAIAVVVAPLGERCASSTRRTSSVASTRCSLATLIRSVEQGAIRIGYLLSGDLGSAFTNVRRRERIHGGELGRDGTSTGDLIRFALGDESVALRKQLGITRARGCNA